MYVTIDGKLMIYDEITEELEEIMMFDEIAETLDEIKYGDQHEGKHKSEINFIDFGNTDDSFMLFVISCDESQNTFPQEQFTKFISSRMKNFSVYMNDPDCFKKDTSYLSAKNRMGIIYFYDTGRIIVC